jgi:hypothetical protein
VGGGQPRCRLETLTIVDASAGALPRLSGGPATSGQATDESAAVDLVWRDVVGAGMSSRRPAPNRRRHMNSVLAGVAARLAAIALPLQEAWRSQRGSLSLRTRCMRTRSLIVKFSGACAAGCQGPPAAESRRLRLADVQSEQSSNRPGRGPFPGNPQRGTRTIGPSAQVSYDANGARLRRNLRTRPAASSSGTVGSVE